VATKAVPETYSWQPRFTIQGTPTWIDVPGTELGSSGNQDNDDVILAADNSLVRINRIHGYHNTELILKAFEKSGHAELNGNAAEIARNHHENGFEHMRQGWFLPSVSDIMALAASGIEFEDGRFWTSSQSRWNSASAHVVNLRNSNQSGDPQKDGLNLVRPVRVY